MCQLVQSSTPSDFIDPRDFFNQTLETSLKNIVCQLTKTSTLLGLNGATREESIKEKSMSIEKTMTELGFTEVESDQPNTANYEGMCGEYPVNVYLDYFSINHLKIVGISSLESAFHNDISDSSSTTLIDFDNDIKVLLNRLEDKVRAEVRYAKNKRLKNMVGPIAGLIESIWWLTQIYE